MTNVEAAVALTIELGLDIAPVALAFVDAPPHGCAISAAVVPSACGFWREAEKGVFFAPAAAHFNCPVGAMVMGFDLPQAVSEELTQVVGMMTKCGYVSAEEPGSIPTNKPGAKGIVYGPLSDFPLEPDAVLIWLIPAQAMIWGEAIGGAEWGGASLTVTGRPACAAIPQSLGEGRAALSLGCIGMRTFTGIAPERMLAVLPGAKLTPVTQALARMHAVNDRMAQFYRGRLDALAVE